MISAAKNFAAALRAATPDSRLLPSCLAAAALLISAPSISSAAPAHKAKSPADKRTAGIGHTCKKRADCPSKAQVCLKESDANGKELPEGLCELPCAPIDAGMKESSLEVTATENGEAPKKKPAPPRCPKKYQCRSAGAGVPIDLCIKE